MNIYKLSLFIMLALMLTFGCSKKKEEAAKLEKEMLNQQDTTTMVDTTAPAVTQQAPESTTAMGNAAAVPQEETQAMPSQPAGEGYTVQVASCENQTYAEYLVKTYTERGYQPYVSTVTIDGQTYYRVRIGVFDNLNEAKALQSELSDKYSVNSWIDKTE
ncbi:MAG: SPOR domain-containing protein [FCB group bacterium]|nr:SPOR domain-containing protein [FCB group bacterium]